MAIFRALMEFTRKYSEDIEKGGKGLERKNCFKLLRKKSKKSLHRRLLFFVE